MTRRSLAETNFNGSTVVSVGSGDFQSTPGLFPKDGDLTLSFLSGNGVVFQEPMDDLWYRATSQGESYTVVGSNQSSPAYQPEEAASPIACFQQYQLCDGSDSRCGPLSSWLDAQTGAAELFGTTADALLNDESPPADNPSASRYIWFVALMTESVPGLEIMLNHLGANALVSTQSLVSGLMGPLPNNQWQIDVTHWWATYLAGIQAGVVATSYGHTDSSLQSLLIKPFNNLIQTQMCDNQVSHLQGTPNIEMYKRLPEANMSSKSSSSAQTTRPSVCSDYTSHMFLVSSLLSWHFRWNLSLPLCTAAAAVVNTHTWNGPPPRPSNSNAWPSKASNRGHGLAMHTLFRRPNHRVKL